MNELEKCNNNIWKQYMKLILPIFIYILVISEPSCASEGVLKDANFYTVKFRSLTDTPPIQSSKTANDCWSPPLESCFFFQNKNSFTEMQSIY